MIRKQDRKRRYTTHRIFRVGHGIEWPQSKRKLVDDEVVGIIFIFDDAPQSLLILGTNHEVKKIRKGGFRGDLLDIIQYPPLHPVLDKEVDSFFECQN